MCTNCVLDRSDKNCPIVTEIDLVVYDSVHVRGMGNFDWFCGTVMQRGCASILEDDERKLSKLIGMCDKCNNVARVTYIRGIGNKVMYECLFDFANTTNPMSGIICPAMVYGVKL